MVRPQHNEPHSLPKENLDNIHEADSTEKHRLENRFQPVCLHFFTDFSADECEPLYYLTVTCNFNYKEPIHRCMIKMLWGKGWWMGRGVAVKDARSGVVGGGGPLRDLSKNILKQGVGKGKSCS